MTIATLSARPLLDSRGAWTLAVMVELDDGTRATVGVPQGTSAGSREAVSLPAKQAVAQVGTEIAARITGMRAEEQAELDRALIELDGTENKSRLGANAILGVSLACATAAAEAKHMPLWHYLAEHLDTTPHFPRLYANLINGGLHAGSRETFQEYLVIPEEREPRTAIAFVTRLYAALGEVLHERFGAAATLVGLEGGYGQRLEDPAIPFHLFQEAAERLGDAQPFHVGLDAAAGTLTREADELTELYRRMAREAPLRYLEDPYSEDDIERFAHVQKTFGDGVQVAGDDLTATNLVYLQEAYKAHAINAVIIKPNQVGTLTETFAAVRLAREYGWHVVVSHRSGETNDAWIADIAYALGADGFKLGAPSRGERVAKYNRLLAIAETVR